MRQAGVRRYDMNGLLNDGVSNFKLGFTSGVEMQLFGTFDAPLSPLYQVWEKMLPFGKKLVHLKSK
jgi:lipid II:glycine glycyltransferase (peptidoglycan interpeptide bridge formation enzyme)